MILIDSVISQLCQGKVPWYLRLIYFVTGNPIGEIKPLVSEHYDPTLINPASLDLRIGYTAKLRLIGGHENVDLSAYSKARPYMMQPGDRLLVGSLETFNMPRFLCAQFRLKSSRAREFMEHLEAGFADPGWNGSKLTMELINMDCEAYAIYPGLRIGQLVFSLTLGIPDRCYAETGRYNGDRQVEASKG